MSLEHFASPERGPVADPKSWLVPPWLSGKYAYEFMDYTVEVLRKCKEYGFKVSASLRSFDSVPSD